MEPGPHLGLPNMKSRLFGEARPSGTGDLAILEGFLEQGATWLINLHSAKCAARARACRTGVRRLGSPPASLCVWTRHTLSGPVSHLYSGELGPDGLA